MSLPALLNQSRKLKTQGLTRAECRVKANPTLTVIPALPQRALSITTTDTPLAEATSKPRAPAKSPATPARVANSWNRQRRTNRRASRKPTRMERRRVTRRQKPPMRRRSATAPQMTLESLVLKMPRPERSLQIKPPNAISMGCRLCRNRCFRSLVQFQPWLAKTVLNSRGSSLRYLATRPTVALSE